ncbi:MAG: hypothetical protein ACR2GQ_04990 [Gemmatimonadota bacterium]
MAGLRPAGRREAVLVVILLGAFGPYLYKTAGLRTDHLIIYGVGLWTMARFGIEPRLARLPATLWVVVGCLVAATAWTLLVSVLVDSASTMEIVASAESYFQPVALIAGLAVLVAVGPWADRRRRMFTAIAVICLLLTVNTAIAIASVFFDTWPLVRIFVRETAATGTSVWENAALNGRFSGVFDQPMEAGVAYSAGLAAWVYWVARLGRPTVRHLVLLGALVIGGFLSVSKVFILGGLPLCLVYLAWTFRMKPSRIARYFLAGLVFVALFVPAAVWLMNRWSGQIFFLRLFDSDLISSQGLIALYSAGRFGAGPTTVSSLFSTTWAEAPLQGFGFAAFSPLDSAYIQFFYQGGMVALALYALMLGALAVHAFRHRRVAPEESRLLVVLLILVLGAGIGAPALTLNRASTILWTLIVLAVCTSSAGRTAARRRLQPAVGRGGTVTETDG